ncbi:MAG: DUF3459 domain-containing protein, partial [Sedimenticolaceae bacterium]
KELESSDKPENCTFLNFTASHDGVGLRPLEGLVPTGEVQQMLDDMRRHGGYISTKSNTDGTESPYELNISYFDAFRDSDGDNRWQVPMFMVSQIISLSFKGIPAVYIHCLTATPNDALGVERTGMTRSVNRRKWDLGELESLICRPDSETGRVFPLYQRLLVLRRQQAAMHPDAAQRIFELNERVFCFERAAVDDSQRVLVLANLSSTDITINLGLLPAEITGRQELLGLNEAVFNQGALQMQPYAIFWFSRQN